MATNPFVSALRSLSRLPVMVWQKYRALRPRTQVLTAIAIVVVLIALLVLSRPSETTEQTASLRSVTLETIGTLSGTGSARSVLGTVRSITEAEILAQTGGTVRGVNTTVGAGVGASAVLAELENSAERAAVLQAEGAYDAALANRSTTVTDTDSEIRTKYQSAFTDLDTTLENDVDLFFGGPTAHGPDLLISAGGAGENISEMRRDITELMSAWRRNLGNAGTAAPTTLLSDMESVTNQMATFLTALATATNKTGSNASAAQVAALMSARATTDVVRSSVINLRNDYEAEKARSASGTPSATEASIKQALGNLRLAQSALEKTVIRAPISGTVNFLPIRVGDYVTAFTHVATVAQNGALEIVAFVSEDERATLAVGMNVQVEETISGVITSIAPALDPVAKQIEIHIAVTVSAESTANLVNGQSVRISIPSTAVAVVGAPVQAGPLLLPLASVKLRAEDRIVFSVDAEGRLVATKVEIGEVRGDRIEVLTPLSSDMRIVTDARGLAEGESVQIASQ